MVIGALETLEKFRWVAQQEIWCWHSRKYGGGPVNYSVSPVQTGSQEFGV